MMAFSQPIASGAAERAGAVLLLVFGLALPVNAQVIQFGGYLEHQLFPQKVRGDLSMLEYSKLRIDARADPTSWLSFTGDVVGQINHGNARFNGLDLIPESVAVSYAMRQNRSINELRPDFDYRLADEYYLDNAFASVFLGRSTVRIGRQQLTWGSGYAWNPTDIFQEKNFLDPTYEKRGVDAIQVSVPTSDLGAVSGIVALDEPLRRARKSIRLAHHVARFDVSLAYLELRESRYDFEVFVSESTRRQLVAIDLSGSIGTFGTWLETTLSRQEGEDDFSQILIGADHTTESGIYLLTEYFHNGRGSGNRTEYTFNQWMQLIGETGENMGRDYVFAGVAYPLTDLLAGSAYVLANLSDGSAVAYPYLEYSLSDNAILTLIGYATAGHKNSEFGSFGWGAILRGRLYF